MDVRMSIDKGSEEQWVSYEVMKSNVPDDVDEAVRIFHLEDGEPLGALVKKILSLGRDIMKSLSPKTLVLKLLVKRAVESPREAGIRRRVWRRMNFADDGHYFGIKMYHEDDRSIELWTRINDKELNPKEIRSLFGGILVGVSEEVLDSILKSLYRVMDRLEGKGYRFLSVEFEFMNDWAN